MAAIQARKLSTNVYHGDLAHACFTLPAQLFLHLNSLRLCCVSINTNVRISGMTSGLELRRNTNAAESTSPNQCDRSDRYSVWQIPAQFGNTGYFEVMCHSCITVGICNVMIRILTKFKQQGLFRFCETGITYADFLLTSAILHCYWTAYNMMPYGCEHLHDWDVVTELYTVSPW
jgi:hypothetical protein